MVKRDRAFTAPLTPHGEPTAGVSPRNGAKKSAAAVLAPLLHGVFRDGVPVRFEFWDKSALGPSDGPGTVVIRSPYAIRRLLWAPGELGIARAYVTGEIGLDGDLFAVLRLLHEAAPTDRRTGGRFVVTALQSARELGVLGPPLPRPAEEASPRGWRHSKGRDARVVSHHYDISNAFYRMTLGPSMTYSCARFETGAASLEKAQTAKHDLICRKLGLHERRGGRLLDVGCGWGSMALHAATHYGVEVVGITVSAEQAKLARQRVDDAGMSDRIEIRVQDYRDVRREHFDAISSVGMFEHVGTGKMAQYFRTLHALLNDSGRFLNHAISSAGGSRIGRNSFIGRYVFPDGELIDVGQVVLAMEGAGFEVRDVESLREHYSRTLHAWVDNLSAHWDSAVAEVGAQRARVWLLYMAASANGFDDGGISLHQVLGIKPGPGGESHMPATRANWELV